MPSISTMLLALDERHSARATGGFIRRQVYLLPTLFLTYGHDFLSLTAALHAFMKH